MDRFFSHVDDLGPIAFPQFTGVRVMMLPIRLEDPATWPKSLLGGWAARPLETLVERAPVKTGVAYLTIDEAVVEAGRTHRRPGLHVDGVGPMQASGAWASSEALGPWAATTSPSRTVIPSSGGWGGGLPSGPWAASTHRDPVPLPGGGWGGGLPSGPWASSCAGPTRYNGMLVASSQVGCRAWEQTFKGAPGSNGDCAHLADQCSEEEALVMAAGVVYGCGALTVHESIPMVKDTPRLFVRLSMPSDAPWYEGYTVNPLGVKPTGPIHDRRAFMDYRATP